MCMILPPFKLEVNPKHFLFLAISELVEAIEDVGKGPLQGKSVV